jgi:hypothetical protein
MLPTISSHVAPMLAPMYTAQRGMDQASKALDTDAKSIASAGPSVDKMVDIVIQPEIYAINARVVNSTQEMERGAMDMLA